MLKELQSIHQSIKKNNTLILNLTNSVTMEFMADALLALGASPIMSQDLSDSLEILSLAQAVNINIGTITTESATHFFEIAKHNNKNKALILDPVGVGISDIRTKTTEVLLPYCTAIRANASEIQAIYTNHQPKGVDSSLDSEQSIATATQLSHNLNIPIIISGQTDWIIHQERQYSCSFGVPQMSQVTGMGCVLSSVSTLFQHCINDPFQAGIFASVFYALCGEQAQQNSQNQLGFFKNNFLTALHQPDWNYFQSRLEQI